MSLVLEVLFLSLCFIEKPNIYSCYYSYLHMIFQIASTWKYVGISYFMWWFGYWDIAYGERFNSLLTNLVTFVRCNLNHELNKPFASSVGQFAFCCISYINLMHKPVANIIQLSDRKQCRSMNCLCMQETSYLKFPFVCSKINLLLWSLTT